MQSLSLTYRQGDSSSYQTRNRSTEGSQEDLKTRNQGIQLSVSYLFDTKIADRKKGKSTYPSK